MVNNWLYGWPQRTALIEIDQTNIDSALSWFPIMLRISGACGQNSADFTRIFDELGAEKLKIAVTTDDGVTELYCEIEKWDDTGEEAIIHISREGWDISEATGIYLYYDIDHADNTDYVGVVGSTPGEKVWDSYFKLVCHMDDNPDTSHVKDSTSNGNNGTKKAANEPIEATGKVGKGQSFDTTDDRIDTSLDIPPTAFTLEAVVKTSLTASADDTRGIIEKRSGWGEWVLTTQPSQTYFKFYSWDSEGAGLPSISSDPIVADTFYHVGLSYVLATNMRRMYLDGIESNNFDTGNTIRDTTSIVRIGTDVLDVHRYWDGIIDEVRISNTARSAAWLKATKHTLWDNLLTIPADDEVLGSRMKMKVYQQEAFDLNVYTSKVAQ